MKEDLRNKVNFNFIRYANCWEDADVLLNGLNAAPGKHFLSVGSAGDNSFSLLTTGAELVVAIDVNRTQLYLITLKKAALAALDHQEFLEFLGFAPSQRRKELFNKIRALLDESTRKYWESNIDQIEAGIISQGKFERYFSFFQRRILSLIHTKKRIEKLFEAKSADEQKRFYIKEWNNWRWRLFFRVFFNKYVMGKYGRDPEFLKQVKITVSQFIFDKAERHLESVEAQKNYFLHFIHTGNFGKVLPHYARPENFHTIKHNISKLVVKEGFAQDAINEYGKFHYMNLSNIFEYMNMETFSATAEQLADGCEQGGRIAYWNLMVPRRISNTFPGKMKHHVQASKELSSIDKGFFYNCFIIDEKL